MTIILIGTALHDKTEQTKVSMLEAKMYCSNFQILVTHKKGAG